MDFIEFNLNKNLLDGISASGYTTCTPVQEQVLKFSQDSSDLYVQSQTGTGKTAAYLIAVIQQLLSKDENNGKKVLVMVPTRELAVQVEQEAKTLLTATDLKAFSFFGGVGYEKQIAAIKKGVDVIIATPGRLIDLQEGKNIDLSNVGFLVIDEADRMFDMGFYPDLRKLLKYLPDSQQRQTMLFSATLNSYVKNLAWEYTRDPKEIEIECENITVSEIDQELLHVSSDEKIKLLVGILKTENPASVIIFCNTKRSCEVVSKRLQINEINASFIIGDLPQQKRIKILNDFKSGKINVLVATDVAARGIDVDNLAMVINFDLPNEAENYVHRIGRTARAGKSGKAYTFCSEQDVYSLLPIERYIEMQIPAKVADSSMMSEDKSLGIYIKTENWNDEYENSDLRASKYRFKKNSSSHSKKYAVRDNSSKAYNKNAKDKKLGGRKDFKKNDRTKYKTNNTAEELVKIQSMSFEERMKFYKEKYGVSTENKYRKKKYDKKPYSKNSMEINKPRVGAKVNSKKHIQPARKNGFISKIISFFKGK